MNLKIFKYNITTAIALTAALWGVEQHPTTKAYTDKVVENFKEQAPIQTASRILASVVEGVKNGDELLILDENSSKLPPEQQKVYEGEKPKAMTHQSIKFNSNSLKEVLSKKIDSLAKSIKDSISKTDKESFPQEDSQNWGWWGGWFKDREKEEKERQARELRKYENSTTVKSEQNQNEEEKEDLTNPETGETSPVFGGPIFSIPSIPSSNSGPSTGSNSSGNSNAQNPIAPPVDVEGENQNPILLSENLILNEDSILTRSFQASDAEMTPLTFVVTEHPTQGQIIINGSNFTYIPSLNYFGFDTFKIQAFDGEKYSEVANFNLQINPVNDSPIIITNNNSYSLNTVQDKIIDVQISDIDNSLNCNQLQITSSNLTLIPAQDLTILGQSPNCQLKIKLSHNLTGSTQIEIAINDDSGGSYSQNIDLIIYNLIDLSDFSLTSQVPRYWQETLNMTGTLSNNSQIDVSSEVNWLVNNSNILMNSNNLVAQQSGSSTITASLKSFSKQQSVIIKDWSFLSLSKGYIKMGLNSQEKIRAFLNYNDGSFFEVTKYANWNTENLFLLDLDKGDIISKNYGQTEISAQFGPQMATAIVVVENKILTNIEILGDSEINIWGNQNYQLKAYYSDNSSEVVTNAADWEVSNEYLAISNEPGSIGQVLGISEGTSTIKANLGSFTAEKTVQVSAVQLVSIDVSPKNFIASKNQDIKFIALGTYSNGQIKDISQQVVWSSSINNSLSFNQAQAKVIYTGSSTITPVVKAYLDSLEGQTNLTINPASVSSIFIVGGTNISLAIGDSLEFKAYALLTDAGVSEITDLVQWSINNDNLEVSNSLENRGQVFAKYPGTSELTIKYQEFSASETIFINENMTTYEDEGIGLKAQYFTGPNFNNFKGSRIDGQINFNWGNGTAPLGVGNVFSVKWTGFYQANTTGNIVLCTDSDDGVRLKFDGVYIINNWSNHSIQKDCSGILTLTKGEKYPIELEFYETTGQAAIILYQGPSSGSVSVIPRSQLFPN